MMGYQHRPESGEWQELKPLEAEARSMGRVDLTGPQRELVLRVATQLALSGEVAQKEVATHEGAARIVIELRRRIREGAQRLGQAIIHADEAHSAGRHEESCALLRAYIATEQVPYYREIAQVELRRLEGT